MEEKLAAYRARKRKEKEAENTLVNRIRKAIISDKKGDNPKETSMKTGNSSTDNDEFQEKNDDLVAEGTDQSNLVSWTLRFLKFVLWLCVWGIFIELQFGAVYFTLSLIFFIYFNTRTGKRKEGSLSAYSVFNKDCERIQGTLTAEEMQKNMFRVPGLTA